MVAQLLPIWAWPKLPEYNCSRVRPVGDEWTTLAGEPQPLFGYWSMTWGVFCERVYEMKISNPIIYPNFKLYQIMLWLALIDVVALLCNSVGFGFLLVEGAVFCSRPWIVWTVGCVGLGMWCGACIGCLLLVTYRIFEVMNMSRRFERKTTVCIVLATGYALYFAFLTPPILTNSKYRAMFYDPFIGDVPTEVYVNWPHTANNLLIVLTSASLYIFLCIILITKQCFSASILISSIYNRSLQIFIQASLICVFNVAASLEYIYMNFFPTPQILIELGHLSWQVSHAVPPFIYLTLNKTIRRNCRSVIY
ncbi:hypothetical protein PFISCL1PPCAC_13745, partial [Pristionchus fissidentatus]